MGSAFSEVHVLVVFAVGGSQVQRRLTAMPFGSISVEDRFAASDDSHTRTHTKEEARRGKEASRRIGVCNTLLLDIPH